MAGLDASALTHDGRFSPDATRSFRYFELGLGLRLSFSERRTFAAIGYWLNGALFRGIWASDTLIWQTFDALSRACCSRCRHHLTRCFDSGPRRLGAVRS